MRFHRSLLEVGVILEQGTPYKENTKSTENYKYSRSKVIPIKAERMCK
jgi:hypothetical protein